MMQRTKRKVRQWKAAYDRFVRSLSLKVTDWADQKFHTRRRIENVNLWATQHPKKFLRYTLGLLVLVLLTGLFTVSKQGSVSRKSVPEIDGTVSEIQRTSSMINRLRNIQSRKSEHGRLVQDLVNQANTLKREIDSISEHTNLSHQDSAEIGRRLYQLNIITKTLIPDEKN